MKPILLSVLFAAALVGCSGNNDQPKASGGAQNGGGNGEKTPNGQVVTSCPEINGDFAKDATKLHVETERNGTTYRYRLSATGDWFNANAGTVTSTSGTVHEVTCTERTVEFSARANGQVSVVKITSVGPDQIEAATDGNVVLLTRVGVTNPQPWPAPAPAPALQACPLFNGKYVAQEVVLYLNARVANGVYEYAISSDGPSDSYLPADGRVVEADTNEGHIKFRLSCAGASMEVFSQMGTNDPVDMKFTDVSGGQGLRVRADVNGQVYVMTKE